MTTQKDATRMLIMFGLVCAAFGAAIGMLLVLAFRVLLS